MFMAKQRILPCVCKIRHKCSVQTFHQKKRNTENQIPSIYLPRLTWMPSFMQQLGKIHYFMRSFTYHIYYFCACSMNYSSILGPWHYRSFQKAHMFRSRHLMIYVQKRWIFRYTLILPLSYKITINLHLNTIILTNNLLLRNLLWKSLSGLSFNWIIILKSR